MSDHHIQIGPCAVPIIPVTGFSKLPKEIDLKEVWRLVGPTVSRMLLKEPMWKIISMAYVQGMVDATGSSNDTETKA